MESTMEVGRLRAEKAGVRRQRPAVSSVLIDDPFHEPTGDADTSSGQCKSIALVPTLLNLRMVLPQKRKSAGMYSTLHTVS